MGGNLPLDPLLLTKIVLFMEERIRTAAALLEACPREAAAEVGQRAFEELAEAMNMLDFIRGVD